MFLKCKVKLNVFADRKKTCLYFKNRWTLIFDICIKLCLFWKNWLIWFVILFFFHSVLIMKRRWTQTFFPTSCAPLSPEKIGEEELVGRTTPTPVKLGTWGCYILYKYHQINSSVQNNIFTFVQTLILWFDSSK